MQNLQLLRGALELGVVGGRGDAVGADHVEHGARRQLRDHRGQHAGDDPRLMDGQVVRVLQVVDPPVPGDRAQRDVIAGLPFQRQRMGVLRARTVR